MSKIQNVFAASGTGAHTV